MPSNEYMREYRSRPEVAERIRQKRVADRRRYYDKANAIIQEAKAQPCADCGGIFPPYVMDFDHQGDKSAGIAAMRGRASFDRIRAEISKCEVVCANCHRVRTHGA